jgi:hypothetical protein
MLSPPGVNHSGADCGGGTRQGVSWCPPFRADFEQQYHITGEFRFYVLGRKIRRPAGFDRNHKSTSAYVVLEIQ